MKNHKNILAVILSMSLSAGAMTGCDDPSARAGRPTKRPAALASAVDPSNTNVDIAAYALKPPTVLSVDGQDFAFPSSKLVVVNHVSSGYALRLCSEDPATAIDPGYAGNSFSLDLFVPIDRLSDLPGYQCTFKPADGDSVSGFFLHGFREQLHPQDLHLLFQKNGDETVITMTGQCRHVDTRNPAASPKRVAVSATLHVSDPAS